MLYSIIIPVYNTESYLSACLDSILCQPYSNYEIIIIDDGSTDSSAKICDQYAQAYEHIRVIHKANGGVSSARNYGIEVARGDYLWFVDSDDTVAPNSLHMFNKHSNEFEDLVVFDSLLQQQYLVESLEKLFVDHYFFYHLGFGPCNKLYKKSIIDEFGLRFDSEEAIGEDLLFNVNYYRRIRRILFLQTQIYNYNVRENSAMTTLDDLRYVKQMRLFKKIKDLIESDIKVETLLCLFFMHLTSGINQTSGIGLKGKRRRQVIQYYQNLYNWERHAYYKGLKAFLKNEHATTLGKIRAYYIYRYRKIT